MVWQPIETAPKDGSKVLLWVEDYPDTHIVDDGMPCAVTATWSEFMGEWNLLMAWGYESEEGVYGVPTHWMPLPPPPESK